MAPGANSRLSLCVVSISFLRHNGLICILLGFLNSQRDLCKWEKTKVLTIIQISKKLIQILIVSASVQTFILCDL